MIALIPVGLFVMVEAFTGRNATDPPAGSITTAGRIVRLVDTGWAGVGHPIIAFTDRAGRSVEFQAPGNANTPQLGGRVTVAYRPTDPLDAVDISGSNDLWPIHLVLGLLLALAGGWGAWRIWSERQLRRAFASRP